MLLGDEDDMKRSSSMPFLVRASNSFFTSARQPFIRRVSTTDKLFGAYHDSPFHDLAPIALPGLPSRVSKNNSVASSLDELGAVFEGNADPNNLVVIEGGFSAPSALEHGLAAVCAWNNGFLSGSMNTASPAMRRALGIANGTAADDVTWGLCVSIFCLGALLGCAAAATLANGLGRKRALTLTSAACTLGAALQALAALAPTCTVDCTASLGVLCMLIGRVIAGCGSGAATVVVPIYLGELAPPHLRGAFGVMFQLACVCALLTAQVLGLPAYLGTAQLWPLYLLGGVGIPTLLQFCLRDGLLESPQWLVSRGAFESQEAEIVLLRLRGVSELDFGEARNAVTKELDHMQIAAMSAGTQSGSFLRLLQDGVHRPELRAALLISVCCAMAQQFSGINNAFNFSSTFLAANGMGPSTVTLIAVLMNVGNVAITLLSAWLMDIAGRRSLLLYSTGAMVASICVLSFALTHPGQTWTAPLAICGIVAFVCAFGIGMGPVPWLLPAELFPADKVASGSALAASCNWLANFVCGLVFLPLAAALGGLCFMPSVFILVPFALFVASRVPETRGKSVQQILSELKR